MDRYDDVYRGKVDIEFTPEGIPLLICYSGDPWDISDEEADSQRRLLQEVGILPETTQKRELCAGIGGSVLKLPTVDLNGEASQVLVGNLNPGQDSSAAGGKAEVEVGSVSKCPAADSLATRIGGSVLKRHLVDLDEASQSATALAQAA